MNGMPIRVYRHMMEMGAYLLIAGLWLVFLAGVGIWAFLRDLGSGVLAMYSSWMAILPIGNCLNALCCGICGLVCLAAVMDARAFCALGLAGKIGVAGYVLQYGISFLFINDSILNIYLLYMLVPLGVMGCGKYLRGKGEGTFGWLFRTAKAYGVGKRALSDQTKQAQEKLACYLAGEGPAALDMLGPVEAPQVMEALLKATEDAVAYPKGQEERAFAAWNCLAEQVKGAHFSARYRRKVRRELREIARIAGGQWLQAAPGLEEEKWRSSVQHLLYAFMGVYVLLAGLWMAAGALRLLAALAIALPQFSATEWALLLEAPMLANLVKNIGMGVSGVLCVAAFLRWRSGKSVLIAGLCGIIAYFLTLPVLYPYATLSEGLALLVGPGMVVIWGIILKRHWDRSPERRQDRARYPFMDELKLWRQSV